MRYERVCIEAMGYALPPHVVKSSELEEAIAPTLRRLGLPPGQIEALSGVKERRLFDPGTTPSQVAAMAGEQALANAGVPREKIGVLVCTSVCRDYLEPATSAMVMGHMNMPGHVQFFDIANACLGFLSGIIAVANMIELGQIDYGLVVDGELAREPLEATLNRLAQPTANADDFRQNFATLTLGSGGAAAVLCRKDLARIGHVVRGAVSRSATEHNQLCLGKPDEMKSDPHGLLVHGTALAAATWPDASAQFGWGPESVDEFVGHQVSLSHFTQTFKSLGLPLERALLTFPYLGNTGPASIPLTLALGEAQGRITRGKEVALFGVGSGLQCIIVGVQW